MLRRCRFKRQEWTCSPVPNLAPNRSLNQASIQIPEDEGKVRMVTHPNSSAFAVRSRCGPICPRAAGVIRGGFPDADLSGQSTGNVIGTLIARHLVPSHHSEDVRESFCSTSAIGNDEQCLRVQLDRRILPRAASSPSSVSSNQPAVRSRAGYRTAKVTARATKNRRNADHKP